MACLFFEIHVETTFVGCVVPVSPHSPTLVIPHNAGLFEIEALHQFVMGVARLGHTACVFLLLPPVDPTSI